MIIGIDPGQRGGIAILGGLHDLEELEVFPMPCIEELADRLEKLPAVARLLPDDSGIHVFLEKAQAMPKQGVCSMFTYGTHYGELKGIIIALKIPYTCVSPRDWTRDMHQGTKSTDKPKERSLEACRRLFPNTELIPEGCRKPHEGIVDALLIAEYGRRKLNKACN